MTEGKKNFISIICFALSLVHIGAVGNAAILIVAFLNNDYSGSFWKRIYYLGLIPCFVLCCVLMLGGLLILLCGKYPNETKEK